MSRVVSILSAALLLATPWLAAAQQQPRPARAEVAKKLYCWNEGGQRICSDALPAEAVNNAREEFSASTGQRRGEVQRALTGEERADAAVAAAQARLDLMARETRQRTEQALLANYTDEAELRRVFSERMAILDNNVTTARFNVASMRDALFNALAVAGDRELAGGKVTDKQAATIRERHGELVAQRRMRTTFERERAALEGEIEDTLQRFRLLKGLQPPA